VPAQSPSRSLQDKLYVPYKLASLVDAAADQDIDAAQVLAGTGVKLRQLRDPDHRTSIAQLLRAAGNVLDAGAEPRIAFSAGGRMNISSYGMYGYALLCCATLRHVTELAVKYHGLATPVQRLSFHEEAHEGVWTLEDGVGLEPDSPLYRFFVEFQFAVHKRLGTDLLGPIYRIARVRTRYAAPREPGGRAAYREHLQCPVEFSQPANELRFERRLLDEHPTYRNAITVKMVSGLCECLLDEIGQARTGHADGDGELAAPGIAAQVARLLVEEPGRFDDMETIAARMNITSRTLRRWLQAEGTSFLAVLADVRCALAKQYLRTTRMTTEDIAEALGFSDAANFRHAFRRWTGRRPGEFRSG
jgi:AraC-like DNA-binding protein